MTVDRKALRRAREVVAPKWDDLDWACVTPAWHQIVERVQRALAAAEQPGGETALREVAGVHYGNPDARAEAWNDGWDEAHRQAIGGQESRDWLLRALARHGVSPTTADDIADELLADVTFETHDPGPQCRVTRDDDGAQCRHHGDGDHDHVDQRGQAIDVGHPSNPDQLMARAHGVCWHSPTSDRWPCGQAIEVQR